MNLSLRSACLVGNGNGYLLAAVDELLELGVEHTQIIKYKDGRFLGYPVDWNAKTICSSGLSGEDVVIVGDAGEVLVVGDDVYQLNNIASDYGNVRFSRQIGGEIFVVGMDGFVLRRVGADSWETSFIREDSVDESVYGFECIDGFSVSDLYCVGWGGEIWRLEKKRWASCNSPTNVILTSVCCASSGVVYVCGQSGTVLRGMRDEWEVLATDDLNEDLWSICEFEGNVYCCSSNFVYRIEDEGLVLEDFGDSIPETCSFLCADTDFLWSVGRKDFVVFDGEEWTEKTIVVED